MLRLLIWAYRASMIVPRLLMRLIVWRLNRP